MAGEEDNLGWTALDDNIVGDGTVDGQTKPLDTMLENIIDVRQQEKWERGSRVSKEYFAPSGPEASPRRYTSRDERMTFAVIPWKVRPGLRELHLSLVGEVGCDGPNTTGKIEFRADLLAEGSDLNRPSQITATATGGISAYTLTMDLSDEEFEGGRRMLVVYLQSRSEEQVDTVDLSTENDAFETWELRAPDSTTGEQALDETTAVDYRNRRLYHKSNANADSEKVIGIDEHVAANPATQSANAFDLYELSWFAPQQIAVQAEYRTDSSFGATGAFEDKTAASMAPQQQVTGADVESHPEQLDNIVRRPRCRATGPHGQNEGQDWPTDYYRQWSWVQTNAEAPATLDRQSFRRRYDSSVIRCVSYIKPFYEVLRNNSSQPSPASPNPIDRSAYRDNVITGEMTLKITARQAQSSDTWGNQPSTSNTRTVDATLHRARPQDHYDLANTVYWSRHPQGFDSLASEYRWAWHEGQLSRDDFELFAAVGTQIEIDPDDGLSLNSGQPIRLDLRFESWASGPNTDDLETPNDARFDYHVLCLGTSWWEELKL